MVRSFSRIARTGTCLAALLCGAGVAQATQTWEPDGNGVAYAWPYCLGTVHVGNGIDWGVYRQQTGTTPSWEYMNGGGTSITMSQNNELWVLNSVHTAYVYRVSGVTASWQPLPTNRCEGGSLVTHQVTYDNAIAVGVHTPYVLEQVTTNVTRVRRWTGSCWEQMPWTHLFEAPTSIAIFQATATGNDFTTWNDSSVTIYQLGDSPVWSMTAVDASFHNALEVWSYQ